jgi:hypothetical protein
VPGLAPFVITCVSKSKDDHCPAKSFAGLQADKKFENDKTIEGYFVSGYLIGTEINPGGPDLGVYIISLTR